MNTFPQQPEPPAVEDAEREAVRRSVAAHFPAVAAFLAEEQSTEVVLRPASVNGHRIYVECPTWCVADHVADNWGAVEDITHVSELVKLSVPGYEATCDPVATAHLYADPFTSNERERESAVMVNCDPAESMFRLRSPEACEQFAERLEGFAAAVREQGRILFGGAA